MADTFQQYRRKRSPKATPLVAEMRLYVPGEDMTHIAVDPQDAALGSPKTGDYVARNPEGPRPPNGGWDISMCPRPPGTYKLVPKAYLHANFEPFTG